MNRFKLAFAAWGLALAAAPASGQAPIGTAFSYQGRLELDGQPASGQFAMDFRLFDAATTPPGVQTGTAISLPVDVADGVFTVLLNEAGQFGPLAFDGQARFLEITVNGTPLSPRQPLTLAPYAQTAVTALSVEGIDGHSLDAADGAPVDAVFVDNAGNAGFGTTTPQDRLHVASGNLLMGTGSNFHKLDSGGIARSMLLYDGSDNLQLLAPPDRTMAFRTGTGGFTSVRATLTAAGRLGIGTAAPDVLVHMLNGDVGATGTVTASNLLLERTSDNWLTFMSPVNRASGVAFGRPGSTATELFHGQILYNEAALPDAMQFRTGGNATRMTIEGNGDVGVGTTSPAARFHVLGGAASGAAFQADDVLAVEGGSLPAIAIGMPAAGSGLFRFSKPSRSDAAKIQYNAATGQLFMLADGAVFFGTDSGSGFTSRMTVANDGDVGIGTNAPAGKLHVVASPSGNSSVILPSSSISAAEILDEPGCAGLVFAVDPFDDDPPLPAFFPDPPASMLSQSINAPVAGYVLAIATIGARSFSTGGTASRWGLTTNVADVPDDQMLLVEFNPTSTAGNWSTPVTIHRLFPVPAGMTTVHVVAQGIFGNWEYEKAQFSLMFIPTTYGTAPLWDGGGNDGGSSAASGADAATTVSNSHAQFEDFAALLDELRAEREALRSDIQTLTELKAELTRLQSALGF